MSTKTKYQIEKRHLRIGKSRSGNKMSGKPAFIVSHETANPSAGADAHFNWFNNSQPSASYHWLADATKIIELVPSTEKAWHVQYVQDRRILNEGYANDHALAISMCRPGSFKETYNRYVWAHAKACKEFGLDPTKHIVSHRVLDPQRRTDSDVSWLIPNGVTWGQFIRDVKKVYDEWDGVAVSEKTYTIKAGDTLWAIARRKGIKLDDLLAANPDIVPENLRPGQVIDLVAAATEPRKEETKVEQPQDDKYELLRDVPGYFTGVDAMNKRNPRTSVKKGTYYVFNRYQKMINVTQKKGTAGSWINPSDNTGSSSSSPDYKVGQRVRVKQSARTYTTGQNIPSWVKGSTYTIQQVASDRVLLREITSWVRKVDVE